MSRFRSLYRLSLVAAVLIAAITVVRALAAQEPEIPTLRGSITAVQPPDSFDVAGYHIITSKTTQFSMLNGSRKTADEVRHALGVGAYVHVIGDKDNSTHSISARQVKVRNDTDNLSGVAVIDHVDSRDPLLLFRADGYHVRLPADAEISFKGDIAAISGIDAGTWIRYEGSRDASGDLVVTKAQFIKPRLHKPKGNSSKFAQITEFPPGSRIDFDGSFQIKLQPDKTDDAPGGECGWYPVPNVPGVQENVRRIGMSLVPRYQRDLEDDDPAKIPFRFYLVDERIIRSDLSCHEGLVLIPVSAFNRLTSKDQLAAILADGIAASLQHQQARFAVDWRTTWEEAGFAALSAAGDPWGLALAGGTIGGAVVNHNFLRKLEEQRGRIALSLMADAGYDPWQAPEAWRLLAPDKAPKDPATLKYPDRASYQLRILHTQYKPAAPQAANTDGNPQ